jgi:hypothetical protein
MSLRSVGRAWRKSTIALSHQVDWNPQVFRDDIEYLRPFDPMRNDVRPKKREVAALVQEALGMDGRAFWPASIA